MVLVKYRHDDCRTVGWFQMDIADARALFANLRRRGGLVWFAVICEYEVHYFNKGHWSNGVHLLKYC